MSPMSWSACVFLVVSACVALGKGIHAGLPLYINMLVQRRALIPSPRLGKRSLADPFPPDFNSLIGDGEGRLSPLGPDGVRLQPFFRDFPHSSDPTKTGEESEDSDAEKEKRAPWATPRLGRKRSDPGDDPTRVNKESGERRRMLLWRPWLVYAFSPNHSKKSSDDVLGMFRRGLFPPRLGKKSLYAPRIGRRSSDPDLDLDLDLDLDRDVDPDDPERSDILKPREMFTPRFG